MPQLSHHRISKMLLRLISRPDIENTPEYRFGRRRLDGFQLDSDSFNLPEFNRTGEDLFVLADLCGLPMLIDINDCPAMIIGVWD
jgi:hypothetical protein